MAGYDYDLVVLGAGPAGEKGAVQAAYFGKRVAIVEKQTRVGGVSAHTGTIPSKTLRETALFLSGSRQRELYGLRYDRQEEFSVADFLARKGTVVDFEVDRMRHNLDRHGVTTLPGTARILDPHTVRIAPPAGSAAPGSTLTAEVILIATGSSPHRPDFIPFEDIDIDDSDELLDLDRLPATMAILGAGVIGCEYACMLAALGIEITLVDARNQILPFLDRELSEALTRSMEKMGIRPIYEDEAKAVRCLPGRRIGIDLRSGRTLEVDRLLYTTGRTSNTADLGLDRVGIQPEARGRIVVDTNFRTSCPSIYAAGDVIGFPGLASTSMEQARVAVCHAFGFAYKRAVDSVIPYGIYTIPEISTVGETEAAARQRGADVEVGLARYDQNARGKIIGDHEGFIKLVFEAGTEKLLGVHVLGERATELIHIGQAVLHFGGTLRYFIDVVFNYPTLSETFKYAAYDGLGRLAARGSPGATGRVVT